ncbi:LysR family transcriptional regulator [Emcibacter sp.]|uniref:LysR family transcriptional regulator n=1 Tax=Emcibacter sp. TaxID=1979954 RepID=UPI003A914F95
MDITLVKTFLEVVASDSFAAAADKLYVSQSAVSLRVKSLEEQLGRKVFVRSKTGIKLTPAGHQFQRYAQSILQVWEEAKQQVAVPEGYRDVLVIAGEYSLWNRLLIRWLPLMADHMPDIAFRAEVARPDRITRQMIEGIVDMAVMYTPQVRPGINVETLFEDTMVFVTTDPLTTEIDDKYVFVDWGEEFTAFHATQFPDYHHPRMTFNLGPITLNYLLNIGGSAFLPKRLVDPFADDGLLFFVPDMPEFPFPVHVAWRDQIKPKIVEQAIIHLKDIVDQTLNNELPAPFWR